MPRTQSEVIHLLDTAVEALLETNPTLPLKQEVSAGKYVLLLIEKGTDKLDSPAPTTLEAPSSPDSEDNQDETKKEEPTGSFFSRKKKR